MDSPLSDRPDIVDGAIDRLKHAIWHSDWDDAVTLAGLLGREATPQNHTDLKNCLVALEETLSLAKASRLELFSALGRLQAVAGFSASANAPTE